MSEKISQMQDGTPAQSTDIIPIVRSFQNFSVSAQSIANLGGGGGSLVVMGTNGVVLPSQKIVVGASPLSSGTVTVTLSGTSIFVAPVVFIVVSYNTTNGSPLVNPGHLSAQLLSSSQFIISSDNPLDNNDVYFVALG